MIPDDKAKHFLGGFLVGLGALALKLTPVEAMLLVAGLGLGKEAWDLLGNGTPDPWDALATIAGGPAAAVVWAAVTIR